LGHREPLPGGLVAIILLAIHHPKEGLITAEVLVRALDTLVVEKLKAHAAVNGKHAVGVSGGRIDASEPVEGQLQ
jgi:hypothetical protein